MIVTVNSILDCYKEWDLQMERNAKEFGPGLVIFLIIRLHLLILGNYRNIVHEMLPHNRIELLEDAVFYLWTQSNNSILGNLARKKANILNELHEVNNEISRRGLDPIVVQRAWEMERLEIKNKKELKKPEETDLLTSFSTKISFFIQLYKSIFRRMRSPKEKKGVKAYNSLLEQMKRIKEATEKTISLRNQIADDHINFEDAFNSSKENKLSDIDLWCKQCRLLEEIEFIHQDVLRISKHIEEDIVSLEASSMKSEFGHAKASLLFARNCQIIERRKAIQTLEFEKIKKGFY